MRSGFEAIMFQANNQLGRNISNTISKAFQYRNSIDYTNVNDSSKAKYRQALMMDYSYNKLFPELKKIIKDGCGLIINDVYVTEKPCLLFAMSTCFDNEIHQYLENKRTGYLKYQPSENTAKLADELASEMKSSINLKKSTIKVNSKFKIDLYFDYLAAFCIYDFLPQKLLDEFTPDELTGILLHEIGHQFENMEHASDTYFKLFNMEEKLNNINDNLLNNENKQEVAKLIKTKIVPLLENNNFPSKLTDITYKIADKIDNDSKYGDQLDKTSIRYAQIMGYAIGNLFYIFFMVIIRCFELLQMRRLIYFGIYIASKGTMKLFGLKEKPDLDKNSETADTLIGYKSIEMRADEFVSRHGYGSSLATALAKISDIDEFFNNADVSYGYDLGNAKNNVRLFDFCKTISTILTTLQISRRATDRLGGYMLPMPDMMDFAYDSEVERLNKLLVNVKSVFKQNLSGKEMSKWIIEYERLRKTLEDVKKRPRNSMLTGFMKKLMDILIIGPSNYEKELKKYEPFLNQLNELINNDMYYNSNKFLQLASYK